MNNLLIKLNHKNQKSISILNAPEGLVDLVKGFSTLIEVKTEIGIDKIDFALIFCTKLEEVNKFSKLVDSVANKDALFWFAYPKGSSKKYKCEFNRDNGWQAMGDLGYEPVRMVAIDDDWSALRFKKVDQIKNMTRHKEMVLSKQGLEKTKGK
jgi:hypothetical protein